MKQIKILWIHFNSLRPIFMDCPFFLLSWDVISWMRRFSVSVKKINSFKDVFVEDENSVGGGYQRMPR